MKDMTLTLIDKKYTVEMDPHEYIKYLAYKLGIPVSKNKKPQTLRQYYADFVEIFSVRLSSNSQIMTIEEIQEYAEALHIISMMFDSDVKEALAPIPAGGFRNTPDGIVQSAKFPLQGNYDDNGKIDLTKKTDYCTYIPKLDIYVKDYGTDLTTNPVSLWYINQFDVKEEVSMDNYTIISETIETSKKSQAIH